MVAPTRRKRSRNPVARRGFASFSEGGDSPLPANSRWRRSRSPVAAGLAVSGTGLEAAGFVAADFGCADLLDADLLGADLARAELDDSGVWDAEAVFAAAGSDL